MRRKHKFLKTYHQQDALYFITSSRLIFFQGVWPLLIESALILLQTAPTHIASVDDLKARLLQNIDGVLALHEFHVWQVKGDQCNIFWDIFYGWLII